MNKKMEADFMEVSKVELEFEDGAVVEEYLGNEKDGQKTIKIEISTAIFIQKKYEDQNYINVEVIPFHRIKSCDAVLDEEEDKKGVPFHPGLRSMR